MLYLAFSYLMLPLFIFFQTWLQLTYGLVFSGLLVYGISWFLRRLNDESFTDHLESIGWRGWLLAVVPVWVFFFGVGSFANQYWDHHFRNAIFRDLIRYDWPVYYSDDVISRGQLIIKHNAAFG